MAKKNKQNINVGNGLKVNITHTAPTDIIFHQIEDKHLDTIMKANSPIWNLAIGCLSMVFGFIPYFISIIKELNNKVMPSTLDIIFIFVAIFAFGIGICAIIVAIFGKNEAKELLLAIRNRKNTTSPTPSIEPHQK
jgi:amino acid permease